MEMITIDYETGLDKWGEIITKEIQVHVTVEMKALIEELDCVDENNRKRYHEPLIRVHYDGNQIITNNYGKPHRHGVMYATLSHVDDQSERIMQEAESEEKKKRLIQKIRNAVDALPAIHRRRVRLYFYEGLPMREIARTEGVNISNISRSINCAMKEIVNKL